MGGDAGDGGVGGGAIEVHRLGQVDLGDQHQIGSVEDRRVLEGLVLALGGGDQHHPQALAQVVGAGAHQVAHVLDHQQLQLLEGHALVLQAVQPLGHHRRLQVAGLAGGDRGGAQAGGLEAAGVVVGGQIAHDHRQALPVAATRRQAPGQGLQQGGLARAGGGEQVHCQHAGGREALAQGGGAGVVALQQGAVQRQGTGGSWRLRRELNGRLSAGAVAAHGGTGGGHVQARSGGCPWQPGSDRTLQSQQLELAHSRDRLEVVIKTHQEGAVVQCHSCEQQIEAGHRASGGATGLPQGRGPLP